jgi:hypothetical protein
MMKGRTQAPFRTPLFTPLGLDRWGEGVGGGGQTAVFTVISASIHQADNIQAGEDVLYIDILASGFSAQSSGPNKFTPLPVNRLIFSGEARGRDSFIYYRSLLKKAPDQQMSRPLPP